MWSTYRPRNTFGAMGQETSKAVKPDAERKLRERTKTAAEVRTQRPSLLHLQDDHLVKGPNCLHRLSMGLDAQCGSYPR